MFAQLILAGLLPIAEIAPAQDKTSGKEELAKLIERAKYDARAEIVEALLSDAKPEDYLEYAGQLKRRGLYEKAAIFYLFALKTGPKELVPRASYQLAGNFAQWEQSKHALNYLQKAVDAGFWGYELMREDEELKSLRDNAVYQKLLAEVQRRYESEASKHAGGSLLRKPEGMPPVKGWPVLVLLHGYGSNKENMQDAAALAAKLGYAGLAVSGPVVLGEGSYRWSSDGVNTTHQYLVSVLNEHKDQGLDRERVYVAGFSQGALHAVLLTASKPESYAGALAISPGGLLRMPDKVTDAGKARPLFLLGGTKEPAGNVELRSECEKLWQAAKWPVKIDTHDGGHQIPPDWQKRVTEALKWLESPR
jgi:predicted esterase